MSLRAMSIFWEDEDGSYCRRFWSKEEAERYIETRLPGVRVRKKEDPIVSMSNQSMTTALWDALFR